MKGEGTVGLITYLRTDSTRISEEADQAARDYIAKNYGDHYVTSNVTEKKPGQKIQDAHEAIRPSDIRRSPALIKELRRELEGQIPEYFGELNERLGQIRPLVKNAFATEQQRKQ